MKKIPTFPIITLCLLLAFGIKISQASQITVTVYSTKNDKHSIGKVIFKDVDHGLLILPQLFELPPGLHGFHVHQNPNCTAHGDGAGGHQDPHNTHSHQGPYGKGHLGDLPVLYVDTKGRANTPTLAPRLKTSELRKHTLMIHEGGDNYSDKPAPLGGGGARVACGVIE